MTWRDRLARTLDRINSSDCPYCHAIGDCHPSCVTRACPLCGGLGAVIDLDNPVGFDENNTLMFGGKPCPRGCPAP